MNIAVITGASSGIGREFALQIDRLEKSDEIWLVARRKDRLETLAGELRANARLLLLDLCDEKSFDEYSRLLESEKPNVRYLVNASGFGTMGDYSEIPRSTQMKMIDLNIKALVMMTDITIPYMDKGGCILQMGSASVFNPLPYFNIYASTKSFVRHHTRALHEELRPAGINVTVVCPGWVKTEFFDHTNDKDVSYSPKSYKPMTEATYVVKRALRDVKRNKSLSIYGWFTKLQHVLAKLLPNSWVMAIWKGMLKKNK